MPGVSAVAGFPTFEVEFDRLARLINASDPAELDRWVDEHGSTDLIVFSHGWNNDLADARGLAARVFAQVRSVLDGGNAPDLASRRLGLLLVFWPSKRFTESSLIPGGTADAMDCDLPESALLERLGELETDFYGRAAAPGAGLGFDHPDTAKLLARMRELVPNLESDPDAREEFGELTRQLGTRDDKGELQSEGAEDGPSDAIVTDFLTIGGRDLVDSLQAAPVVPRTSAEGEGAAAGIVDAIAGQVVWLYNGVRAGAERVLNYSTYYRMKVRAGTIGREGLDPLLHGLTAGRTGLAIHLVGHSFGGRLVSAAACGAATGEPLKPASLTLLQAAFSHFGFARNYDPRHTGTDGMFRRVVRDNCVHGPILVTHTVNDRAVGLAYAIASRLSGEAGAGIDDLIGGPGDFFGGIGRNGALATPECVPGGQLQPVGRPYSFSAGRLYNLRADEYIPGHNDIDKAEVAFAMLSAVASTAPNPR